MKKFIEKNNDFTTRDPHIIAYDNMYYRCYTKDTESIYVSCAETIDDLSKAKGKCVYIPEENREYSKQLWAPELHIIDGKCYIYVACDDGDDCNHRMYVLENNSANPMDNYVMHGKIADSSDKWAIDGTVMKYNGSNYFIWSGCEGDINICQNLYIAKMKNPFELEGERVMISTPEYDWEKFGSGGAQNSPCVNEGPYAFTLNNTQYVSYSASGSWRREYCIALLKLTGSNPLNPKSWKKLAAPLLSCNDKVQGSGHCSVVCDNDATHVFFHAWDKSEENIKWQTVSVWHANLSESENGIVIE